MKKMKCRDIGGSCDEVITGNTPEEMGENSKKHVMSLMEKGDTSHNEAMEKMRQISPEEFQAFMVDFRKKFEAAEEV